MYQNKRHVELRLLIDTIVLILVQKDDITYPCNVATLLTNIHLIYHSSTFSSIFN